MTQGCPLRSAYRNSNVEIWFTARSTMYMATWWPLLERSTSGTSGDINTAALSWEVQKLRTQYTRGILWEGIVAVKLSTNVGVK